MTDLERPICQARRRLWLNRWLSALGWTLTGAAGLFVLVVAAQRSWVLVEEAPGFFLIAAASLAAAALVAAVIWLAVTRETREAAAVRLDVAAGLKERLSSGLYCTSLSDPFAQAVVVDARRAGQGLQPRRHLPIRLPRSANYASGSFLAALLVLWLFPTLDLAGSQSQKQQQRHREDAVARSEVRVKKILQDTLSDIRKKNPALKEELDGLEPLQTAQLENPLDVRRQAFKKVEKISEQLDKKRNRSELAKAAEFKKMMRQLAAKAKSKSAVGRLSQALAKGDFKSAQAAIADIKKQLAKKPKNEQEKQRADALKKQLEQLSNQLNQIAQNDRKLRDKLSEAGLDKKELEKALENLKNKDFEAVAKQLADKGLSPDQIKKAMQQMKKRCQACSAASKLASNLGMAAQGAGAQGAESAAGEGSMAGLSAAGQQLSEMEGLEQELQQLNAAMSDLNGARDQLGQVCQACNGTGMANGMACAACQGSGMGPGMGMGAAPGQGQGGFAPEQQAPFKTVTRRTEVKTRQGAIISQRFVDGEQYKGELSKEFVEAVISAERDATDAIAREQIPRLYHSSVQKYFTRSQRALPTDKSSAESEKTNP